MLTWVRRLAAGLSLACLVASAGCSDAPDLGKPPRELLVGAWSGRVDRVPLKLNYTFRKDGTLVQDLPVLGDVRGKWSARDEKADRITVRTEMPDVEAMADTSKIGEGFGIGPAANAPPAGGRGPDGDGASPATPPPTDAEEFTVVFESADRIRLIPLHAPDETATLTRQQRR